MREVDLLLVTYTREWDQVHAKFPQVTGNNIHFSGIKYNGELTHSTVQGSEDSY